jgi:hypothetical protein
MKALRGLTDCDSGTGVLPQPKGKTPPPAKKNHTHWLIDTKTRLSTVDGRVVVQLAYAGRHNENRIRNKPTAI